MAKGPANPERSFGISVGAVLMAIAAFAWWRNRILSAESLGGVGFVLFVLGYLAPKALYYPSKVWWRFALALGYVNARIILTLAFLIVLVPLGLLWRLIGRDPLGHKRASWKGWAEYPARYQDGNHFTRMY
jgi:hypothetical protein